MRHVPLEVSHLSQTLHVWDMYDSKIAPRHVTAGGMNFIWPTLTPGQHPWPFLRSPQSGQRSWVVVSGEHAVEQRTDVRKPGKPMKTTHVPKPKRMCTCRYGTQITPIQSPKPKGPIPDPRAGETARARFSASSTKSP